MKLLSIVLTAVLFLTANLALAEDTRAIGVEEVEANGLDDSEFEVKFRTRTAKEMLSELDKTQKYLLIIGQDENLYKEDMLAIKECILAAPAAEKENVLKTFDAVGSSVSDLASAVQDNACKLYEDEKRLWEEGLKDQEIQDEAEFKAEIRRKQLAGKLTTPHTGLDSYIKSYLYSCLHDKLSHSNFRAVKTRSDGLGLIFQYSKYVGRNDSIYCPK